MFRFIRRHRQWAMLIGAASALLVAAGAISLTIVENVSKGPAYSAAVSFLRNDRLARQQLGVVTGFGLAVTGSVAEAGQAGTAHLSFDVHGQWRNGHVHITAVKHDGLWHVRSGILSVAGEQFKVPCVHLTSITSCRLS
jgi:hypothetical protein